MEQFLTLTFWEHTSWLQQIAAIFTIAAIPYAFFRLVFYKAKHKIYFVPSETYQEAKLIDAYGQPQSIWLQVMVRNTGLEISKAAKAQLSEIWSDTGKGFGKLKDFRAPVQLKWSHEEDFIGVDILPKESRRLDVCFITEGGPTLRLMAKGFPSGTIKNALPSGKYLFKILVASENQLHPSEFLLSIVWDGNWKSLLGKAYIRSFRLAKIPAKSFRHYSEYIRGLFE